MCSMYTYFVEEIKSYKNFLTSAIRTIILEQSERA